MNSPHRQGEGSSTAPARRPPSFRDRLLAEAVRHFEGQRTTPLDDVTACDEARTAGGDLETRLLRRAGALPEADELAAALRHARRTLGLIVITAIVLGLLAGIATARTALGASTDTPVNFYLVFGSILGVQTLLLVLWAILAMARPQAIGASSLGGLAVAVARWLVARLHRGPEHLAGVQALGSTFAGGPVGRWSLGSISHGIWLAFNVGALGAVLVLLSARQYAFGWETTILSDDAYVRLTHAVAILPELAGFPTPDQSQIIASRWTGSGPLPTGAARAWSGLLVGSVVLYGFAPRLLLLALCLGRRRGARSAYRLDTSLPGFARLRPVLMPSTRTLGVVDRNDMSEPAPAVAIDARAATGPAPDGPPAILGFEIDEPASPWPTTLEGVAWSNLGFVRTGDDQDRAIASLTAAEPPPRCVVAVCALTTTPDRGVGEFLRRVRAVTPGSLILVLTAGDTLRRRTGTADELEQRVHDWRRLATAAGIAPEDVAETDLDHLTDASRARLAAAVGAGRNSGPASAGRRIESSFDLILEHARSWGEEPPPKQQAELHEAIARIYRDDESKWRELLAVPASLGTDIPTITGSLRRGAERMRDLLPARLRTDPRWLAAGAASGALGCLAAAALLSPAAIAALPAWSALGAAIAAVIPSRRAPGAPEQAPDVDGRFAEAVRAAALFALLLELQGRAEASITRLLDAAIGDDEPPEASAAAALRSWLDGLRHRLDLALLSGDAP